MKRPYLIRSVIAGFILGIALYGVAAPQVIIADSQHGNASDISQPEKGNSVACAKNQHAKDGKHIAAPVKKILMVITAYASVPEETDDNPFITASGKLVSNGIVANNFLPFGTKISIPSLGKTFTVEDRMNKRMGNYHIDIWMPSVNQAKEFGAKITEVDILQS